MNRPTRVAAAAGGLVVLAGCATSPPEPVPQATGGTAGPLTALLSPVFDWFDPLAPGAVDGHLADVAAREDRTASCMREKGFEYWPRVPGRDDVDVVTDGWDRDGREFAAAYGYGLADQPARVNGSVTIDYGPADDGPHREPEPNAAYRESLSPAAQAEYDVALDGEVVESGTTEGGGTWQRRAGGCLDVWAVTAHPVLDEANEFLATITADGAFDEVNALWSACMSRAGYAYPSPAAAEDAYRDEWWDLRQAAGTGPLPPELGERERATALASWDCRAEVGYAERAAAIQVEVEQRWIDAHRAELDAWAAELEGASP